jgi:hypothetical protein
VEVERQLAMLKLMQRHLMKVLQMAQGTLLKMAMQKEQRMRLHRL